MFMPGIKNSLQ